MRSVLLISGGLANVALAGILAYQVFCADLPPASRFWLLTALLLSMFTFASVFVLLLIELERVDGDGKHDGRS